MFQKLGVPGSGPTLLPPGKPGLLGYLLTSDMFDWDFVCTCFSQGFERVYEFMPDIAIDVPAAYAILERFVIRCRKEGIITDELVRKMPSRSVEDPNTIQYKIWPWYTKWNTLHTVTQTNKSDVLFQGTETVCLRGWRRPRENGRLVEKGVLCRRVFATPAPSSGPKE